MIFQFKTLLLQIYSTGSFEAPPSGYLLMQTKTYFTTSTFFTTYIDKSKTITKTRTNVRSSVLTETYTGGQFDFVTDIQSSSPASVEVSPKEKYLSLGPNIYGLVKTLYTTFTYYNGLEVESREVRVFVGGRDVPQCVGGREVLQEEVEGREVRVGGVA